jgi:sirohydrochlorin cobaltochelatase
LKEGIVLVAHGSRDPQWAQPFERIAEAIARQRPAVSVALAFLEHGRTLHATVAALAEEGVAHVRVVPVFLGAGGHVKQDLPRLVREAARRGVSLVLDRAIGEQPRVVEAIAAAICAEPAGAPPSP